MAEKQETTVLRYRPTLKLPFLRKVIIVQKGDQMVEQKIGDIPDIIDPFPVADFEQALKDGHWELIIEKV